MDTAISTALSGLSADTAAINIIGNDLANLNTTGFKASEIQFEDVLSQTLGAGNSSGQIGLGVGPISSVAQYSQGSVQTTNGATDAAMEGNGFFVVQNQSNETLYTRDGSFQINAQGLLVDSAGDAVQGWTGVNGVVNTNGLTGDITVPQGATVPAAATTSMNVAMNLNSSVATTAPGATFTTPIQVYDSEGTSHDLTATFTKTATNAWSYTLTIPAADLTAGGNTTAASGNLTFDTNGNLLTPTLANDPQTVSISNLADGAANMTVNWNLYDSAGNATITQYAEASGVASTAQNGSPAGTVTDISLQNGGLLTATNPSGQQVTVGQLALASISNPETLLSVGNNNLQATSTTGTPAVGTAGSGSRGQIISGALESSTVDIASEFTNLLTFQRSYQADSRVITTADQMLQDTINLIHE
jgi:flagellar hook protein FlgE